ncbi:MAG: signal peptidase I [Lachnospiraceae bacterium]|nr:signal peptidase I [Lachnospiraceae bacterium]
MKYFLGTLGRALIWVLNLLLIATVITGLTQRFFSKHSIGIFGVGYAVVVSGSMVPALQVDDMIFYHAHGPGDYKVGDIIVYESTRPTGEILVTHRVVEIGDGNLTTLGDANHGIKDEPIAFEKVIGKVVFRIPKMGAVVTFLKSPAGLAVLAVAAAAILAVNLASASSRKKKVRTVSGEQKIRY